MSLLPLLREKMKSANCRLIAAMACYAAIIAIALYAFLPICSSQERFLLGVVLFVIALLIVKTLVHSRDENSE
jgi:Kef-type K+ transport system membrane component KefB